MVEVNNEIKNYMCYGCGFITNSLMKKGERFFEEQFNISQPKHTANNSTTNSTHQNRCPRRRHHPLWVFYCPTEGHL